MLNSLTVSLAGDLYGDSLPQVRITNGTTVLGTVQISAVHGQAAQAFYFSPVWDGTAPFAVTFTFLNDAFAGTATTDRNAYVMGATMNGVWLAPPATNALMSTNDACTITFPATVSVAPPPLVKPPQTTQYDLSNHVLVQDYRFGNARPDATVKNKTDLDLVASPRYIYCGYTVTEGAVGNGCDGLYGNYWARHVDYPEGDPKSVHIFTPSSLILKAANNPTPPAGVVTGRDGGGILSGIMRFWAVVVPNKTFIRARVKLPPGKWGWPALWLNPGHEDYAPLAGPRGNVLQPLGWPPEIDFHDGFGYDNVTPGTLLRPGEPTNNDDAAWGRKFLWENAPWAYQSQWDYQKPSTSAGWLAAGFHEIALDWTDNVMTYYCDGIAYTQRTMVWDNAPAAACAHILISNQVVATFNPNPYPLGVPDQGGGGPGAWNFEISDLQVYQRVSGTAPNPGNLSPAPGVVSTKTWAPLPKIAPSPSVLSFGFSPPAGATTGAVTPSTY